MKKKAKMKFNRTIFDLSILDLIETEFKKYKISDYYDYECDLIIRFNQNDITDDCLSNLNFPYYRPWNDTDVFSEKIELALRYIIGKIKEFIDFIIK